MAAKENDTRLEKIREAEKKSHIETYSSQVLFEKGSWLSKPIKTVTDLFPLFEKNKEFHCLDLGCGVGRNCIPLAQNFGNMDCQIDCVDILDLAIEQLKQYSKKYNVFHNINGFVMPLEEFEIKNEYYDLILGISALEHVKSEACFYQLLKSIKDGVRPNGIVCFIINSEVVEKDIITGQCLVPQFEVNLPTEVLKERLQEVYAGWEIIKYTERFQEYDIPREGMVHLTSNVVTWVARKV